MFIYTIKASKLKFFAVLFLAFGVLAALIALVPDYDNYDDVAVVAYSFDDIASNEDRLKFIQQFGYETNKEPIEIVEVVIPEEFDSVYSDYNELQRTQGLNLKKYKGKTVTRYTYSIQNYPGYEKDNVVINLLVYKSKVIGGDVCCNGNNCFIHGFAMPK